MIKRPLLGLVITTLTCVVCITLIVVVPPRWGIDFTGGSLLELAVNEGVETAKVRAILNNDFGLEANVQPTQEGTFIIRMPLLDEQAHQSIVERLIAEGITGEELRFEAIGPSIGAELRRKAWVAITIAIISMVIYLAYTFRHTAGFISSWKYGVAAIIALIHDLLFVSAAFVLLGYFFDATIDTLFLTAMLAILGYSVNDTIVLFNRFKDEWLANRSMPLLEVLDRAAKLTVTRSLNTSLTTLIVLLSLVILGGPTIYWFVMALVLGTIVGTYSSIFVAPPALYWLSRWK